MRFILRLALLLFLGLPSLVLAQPAPPRRVLWYCLHYQAPGENRYPADGSYKDILTDLRKSFEVRVSAERPTAATLRGINVVLIANPNAAAVGTNLPPRLLEETDRKTLTRFIRRGGGLILMGNQENHNLEIERVNRLLVEFGLALSNDFTDIKGIHFPLSEPVVGGLSWAYYSGNRIELLQPANKEVRCRGWYRNNASEPPLKGTRSATGYLMASAESGKGRVVVVTDSGWITNNALNGVGIGGYYVADHQNAEIMRRLVAWAAGR